MCVLINIFESHRAIFMEFDELPRSIFSRVFKIQILFRHRMGQHKQTVYVTIYTHFCAQRQREPLQIYRSGNFEQGFVEKNAIDILYKKRFSCKSVRCRNKYRKAMPAAHFPWYNKQPEFSEYLKITKVPSATNKQSN
jgi:hypothetical protein